MLPLFLKSFSNATSSVWFRCHVRCDYNLMNTFYCLCKLKLVTYEDFLIYHLTITIQGKLRVAIILRINYINQMQPVFTFFLYNKVNFLHSHFIKIQTKNKQDYVTISLPLVPSRIHIKHTKLNATSLNQLFIKLIILTNSLFISPTTRT